MNFDKTIWFIFKWNFDPPPFNEKHIVVTKHWLNKNEKADGKVVSDEFHDVSKCISECDKLNENV